MSVERPGVQDWLTSSNWRLCMELAECCELNGFTERRNCAVGQHDLGAGYSLVKSGVTFAEARTW